MGLDLRPQGGSWAGPSQRRLNLCFTWGLPNRGSPIYCPITDQPIEIQRSIQAKNVRGLQGLSETQGDAFHRGVVLYVGTEGLPFGPKLWAMPVCGLWEKVD